MIYKRCPRCHKRIPEGTKCECTKNRHKEYKKYRADIKEQKFYSCGNWINKRENIKAKYKNIDLYSYYVLGIIEDADTVHHIIELKDDWSKRYDDDNLITLTESNHQLVHKAYNSSEEEKNKMIKLLKSLIEKFDMGGT